MKITQSQRNGNSVSGKQRGFTLIELMITVAIVGILAAIAYPSYVQYVVRANRAAAQSHLMDIAQRQQQYLLDNRAYAADLTALNMTTPVKVSSRYTIAVTPAAGLPPTFTATATPIAGTAQAADVTLGITSGGVKTPSDKW